MFRSREPPNRPLSPLNLARRVDYDFVLCPLPPGVPPLAIYAHTAELHAEPKTALARLGVAGAAVPATVGFLYGFVRKEAVVTSQTGGTQATLRDVITFEATEQSDRPADVEEASSYVAALAYARAQLAGPGGLSSSIRLLCDTHRILMPGARGRDKLPGEIRRSQNRSGGARPGNGRIGRLLIALLAKHWNLLEQPLLCVSGAFRRADATLEVAHPDAL